MVSSSSSEEEESLPSLPDGMVMMKCAYVLVCEPVWVGSIRGQPTREMLLDDFRTYKWFPTSRGCAPKLFCISTRMYVHMYIQYLPLGHIYHTYVSGSRSQMAFVSSSRLLHTSGLRGKAPCRPLPTSWFKLIQGVFKETSQNGDRQGVWWWPVSFWPLDS